MRLRASNPALIDRAKELRRDQTEAEALLWSLLRNNRLGVRFLRQRPIGSYIVDFYCAKYGLVLELDGQQHELAEHREADAIRTQFLEAHGLHLLRFSNAEVMNQTDGLLATIKSSISLSPQPSP